MRRDVTLFLDETLTSIEKIHKYFQNKSENDFYQVSWIQDAVIRRLEIIGGAVKQIPAEIRENHSNISWKLIAGMRDVLIHGYFGVNLQRV